jgi:hypothetical protein
MQRKALPRDTNGSLAAYAWPGGAPLYYLDEEACVLCVACARQSEEDAGTGKPAVAAGIADGESHLNCDACNASIDTA